MNKSLPYPCSDHLKENIRLSWDEKQYILNGYPVGQPIKSNYRYECAKCGTQLYNEDLSNKEAVARR